MTILFTCCLVPGCAELDDEPDLETEVSAITSAAETDDAPEVVRLSINSSNGSTMCTGVVISEYWIMTAAHCLDGLPTYGTDRLEVFGYSPTTPATGAKTYPATAGRGRASFYLHPDYSGHDHDIGLIRLYDSGLGTFRRARFYVDARQPWDAGSTASAKVTTFGVGRGSDPGTGLIDCDASGLTSGRKRKGTHFTLARVGSPYVTEAKTIASMDGQHLCPGDSGGAWTLVRDGLPLTFAIHSYHTEDYWYDTGYASTTRAHFGWVEDKTATTSVPLTCSLYATAGGLYQYRMCDE